MLGENPFDNFLKTVVETKTIKGRNIELRHFRTIEDYEPCHVLFVSSSMSMRLSKIFRKLKGEHCLVVSDIEGSTQKGAMINFLVVKNKLRFAINLDAARAEGLTISSKLLRLAKNVIRTNGEG